MNLVLDPDGAVRWIMDGIDYVAAGTALWSAEIDVVRIMPEAGDTTFPWMGMGSFQAPATEAVFVRDDEWHVIATVTFANDVVEQQRWAKGHLCRDYCADGRLYGCAYPFDYYWYTYVRP